MFKLVVLSALVAVAMAAPRPGVIATPLAYSAPVLTHSVVAPAAVSHQSRVDIVSKPVVHTTYTAAVAPVVHAAPIVHAAPAVHAVHAVPAVHSVYSHAYGAPVVAHHGLVAAHHGVVAY